MLAGLEAVLWRDGRVDVAGLEPPPPKKLVVLTPYLSDINAEQLKIFEGYFGGTLRIEEICGMGISDDDEIGRVSHHTIKDEAAKLFTRHCSSWEKTPDCVFISCGALRSIEVVVSLEALFSENTGRKIPVLCSNGCMLWHVARLAGCKEELKCIGVLGSI